VRICVIKDGKFTELTAEEEKFIASLSKEEARKADTKRKAKTGGAFKIPKRIGRVVWREVDYTKGGKL